MTSARRTQLGSAMLPINAEQLLNGSRLSSAFDQHGEAARSMGLRALLVLSGAAQANDPALARVSDEDLALVRASLYLLSSTEPTSAA